MKSFINLTLISLRSALGINKKQKPFVSIMIGFLFVYVVAMVSFMMVGMAKTYHEMHVSMNMILVYGLIISGIFTIMLTISASSNVIFHSKDNSILMPLPLPKFYIVGSRFLACLLLCYLYELLLLVPALVIFYIYTSISFVSVLFAILGLLFVPITLFCISLFISALFSYVTNRLRFKNLLKTIFLFAFTLSFLVLYYTIDFESLFTSQFELPGWLFMFRWFIKGTNGDFLSLLALIGSSIALIVLSFWFVSRVHLKISSITSNIKSAGYKEINKKPLIFSLVKKEIKKFFSSPIVIFNTSFGLIFIILGIAYLMIDNSFLTPILSSLQLTNLEMGLAVSLLVSCVLSTCNTASISISLERSNIYILKALPIKISQILLSKSLANIVICMPFILISAIFFPILLKLPFYTALLILGICSLILITNSVFGLLINLCLPKNDAPNDTVITKQSLSSMLGMMLMTLLIGLVVFAYLNFLYKYLSVIAICLLLLALITMLLVTMLIVLKFKAKKLFDKI